MLRKRAKGEGTVTRRRDGRWEGRISFGKRDGKRVRKTVYGDTRAEVAARLRSIAARYNVNTSDVRLGEYLEQWLQDAKSRCEAQTYRTYASWIHNHVIPGLGHRKVCDIESSEIRAWLRGLETDGVGATTRKRALTTLRSALQQLVNEEQLERNPCAPIKGPKAKRRDVHIPDPEEFKAVLDAADSLWLRAYALVAYTLTLRQGEQFALWWSQVDLKAGTIRVDKSLSEDENGKLVRKDTKTKAGRRTLHLPAVTQHILAELKRTQKSEGYTGMWVFPDTDGGPLRKSNFDRRHWAPLLKRADVPHFGCHGARHGGNSLLIVQGGLDPLSLSRRMGHEDTRMTFDLYGHLFAGAGPRSAELMEAALNDIGISSKSLGLEKRR